VASLHASDLALGVLVALGASLAYDSAPLLQSMAARKEDPGGGMGLGLLAKLARRPAWLAGLGLEIVGFVFEAAALALAPLTLVEPILAMGLSLLAPIGARRLGEHLGSKGAVWMGLTLVGEVLTVLGVAHADAVGVPASVGELLLAAVSIGVGAGILLLFAQPWRLTVLPAAGPLLAAAAGLGFGFVAVCTRQVALAAKVSIGPSLLASPAPWLLIVFSILSSAMQQRAYQIGPTLSLFPISATIAEVIAVSAGLVFLGEHLPSGWPVIAVAIGWALVGVGNAGLAQVPAVGSWIGGQAPPDTRHDEGRNGAALDRACSEAAAVGGRISSPDGSGEDPPRPATAPPPGDPRREPR
jgi:hypothetical protein